VNTLYIIAIKISISQVFFGGFFEKIIKKSIGFQLVATSFLKLGIEMGLKIVYNRINQRSEHYS